MTTGEANKLPAEYDDDHVVNRSEALRWQGHGQLVSTIGRVCFLSSLFVVCPPETVKEALSHRADGT